MQDKRSSAAAVLMAVLLSLAVCVGSYVGGYFVLCTEVSEASFAQLRYYRYAWQASLFRPAAVVESWIRGERVQTTTYAIGIMRTGGNLHDVTPLTLDTVPEPSTLAVE